MRVLSISEGVIALNGLVEREEGDIMQMRTV